MKSLSILLLAVNEFGKKRANPYACSTNNLKLTDTCGCTNDPVCRDDILITNPGTQTIVSVDFNGKTFTTDAPVLNLEGEVLHPVLGAKSFSTVEDRKAITDWLTAITNVYEVDAKIEILDSAAPNYYIQHYGACLMENLTVSGAATITQNRCCDVANVIQFKLSSEGAIGSIDWNNVGAQALTNSPYNYVGTPANDLATAAQLETDLTTALNALNIPDLTDVKVTVDDNSGEFVMSYWSSSSDAAISGVIPFVNCASKVEFTCDLPS